MKAVSLVVQDTRETYYNICTTNHETFRLHGHGQVEDSYQKWVDYKGHTTRKLDKLFQTFLRMHVYGICYCNPDESHSISFVLNDCTLCNVRSKPVYVLHSSDTYGPCVPFGPSAATNLRYFLWTTPISLVRTLLQISVAEIARTCVGPRFRGLCLLRFLHQSDTYTVTDKDSGNCLLFKNPS